MALPLLSEEKGIVPRKISLPKFFLTSIVFPIIKKI